ncbi:MAG: radical SAM protein [Methanosarcina sp.]
MRVSLVVPNVAKHLHNDAFEPLGILYIAAQIRSQHDVQIVDAFNRRLSLKETLGEILSFNPDVVGISLTMSPTVPFGRDLSAEIKSSDSRIKIIVGGTHATFASEQLASNPNIDVVVLHEGDITFLEILKCLENDGNLTDISGIVIHNNEEVIKTAKRDPISNLDSLPFPARDILPNQEIYNIRHILSSRGCIFKCIYCASSAMNQYMWRSRSAANVLSEIEILASQYSKTFHFADDNFPVNRQRTVEICKGIIERDLDIKWLCLSRIEFIDDSDLLKTMALSGCSEIFIGVESGSDRVLKRMKRKYTSNDVKRIVKMCFDMGISTIASFIIGNPYETLDDVKRTFDLSMNLQTPNVNFHIFTPYIGTQAFTCPDNFGLTILSNNPEEFDKNTEPVAQTRYLSAEQIMDLYCESFGIALKKGRQRLWRL